MKKVLISLAILLTAISAMAQQAKTTQEIKDEIASAKEASENPKKAAKVATWLKLAQTYMEADAASSGNGMIGQSMTDVQVIMAKTKAKGQSNVTLGNKEYKKVSYANFDYFYDQRNVLTMIYVRKPIVGNALKEALKAYGEALKVDTKGKKVKEIGDGIEKIASKFNDNAVTAYQLGKYSESSKAFEASFNALKSEPVSRIDTSSIYNAAFTAWSAKENERATKFFKTCIKYNYFGSDGDVFAKLSDIAIQAGDTEGAKKYLEDGFSKFPQGQAILVGLINLYLSTGENTDRLFTLLDKAKVNDPKNASLYYVEGTIHEKLGQGEKAVESYRKAVEINPEYTYGYIGEGLYYFKKADEISAKAQSEMDDKKYNALLSEYEATLKAGIPAFEKAFEVEKDPAMKKNIAAYLKNGWFRFRNADDASKAKYEFYTEASK